MRHLPHISPSLLGASLVALGTLVACPEPELERPGVPVSGTVTIDAHLSPLLPPAAAGVGRVVPEVEPNTIPPAERFDVGVVTPGDAPLIITGSLDDVDLRDRILFRVGGAARASVTVTLAYTDGGGATNIVLADGESIEDDESNVLGSTAFGDGDATSASVSSVVEPGRPLLVNLRFLSTAASYTLTITALPGTVVGNVYVVAVRGGQGHPANVSDPLAQPKDPLGAMTVTRNVRIDDGGNWVGEFSGLALLDPQKPLQAGEAITFFAYADNDGSSGGRGANFVGAPVTAPDFVASTTTDAVVPAAGESVSLRMRIDAPAIDADFDGLTDEDRNGDGRPDDNCPTKSNPADSDGVQADRDDDGVGDLCDNCPDVENPDQANTDGLGRGDACNQDGSTACPHFGMYPVASCPVDDDGDEFESAAFACDVGVVACLPSPDPQGAVPVTGPARPLDTCRGVSNPDQTDTDNDGSGDACDDDDDGDGVPDESDTCPLQADTDQRDSDDDAVGDACDNCNELSNDQSDIDGDGLGDACDDDIDDDGVDNDDDNCPSTPNSLQDDGDGDGDGDACDLCPDRAGAFLDVDGDSIGDGCEPAACVGIESPREPCSTDADCVDAGGICLEGGACVAALDSDSDGVPDACDDDADGDLIVDVADNCPGFENSPQTDGDDDGVGDVCDNCPAISNVGQGDLDGDDVGDACDRCRLVPSGPIRCEVDDDCVVAGGACSEGGRCLTDLDTDDDDSGDVCDPDDDNDGICDPCSSNAHGGGAAPICTGAVSAAACTGADNCPALSSTDQSDLDENGIGDVCQDVDGDGIADDDEDEDDDGVADFVDTCPQTANQDQADADADGIGNACDVCPAQADSSQADTDDDGVGDACDNCAGLDNPDQRDADNDGLGNVCDLDADNDGIPRAADNCPFVANVSQTDSDRDGAGDACDVCPGLVNRRQNDYDEDGVGDACDNCPQTPNADQSDVDGDLVGDSCDNCVDVPNRDQRDHESDDLGDVCDDDDDDDGVDDDEDNCPRTGNAGQRDRDGDDFGDACDSDIDGDGLVNERDACAEIASSFTPVNVDDVDVDLSNDRATPTIVGGSDGGPLKDGDQLAIAGSVGGADPRDVFIVDLPLVADRSARVRVEGSVEVRVDGIDVSLLSLDGSSIVAVITPAGGGGARAFSVIIELGGDVDSDGDGIADLCDACLLAANRGDRDRDGIDDACDPCIVAAGSCDNIDADNDGVCDVGPAAAPATCDRAGALDNCRLTRNPEQDDFDRDGQGDACSDADNDGLFTDIDNCPVDTNPEQRDVDDDGRGDICDVCPTVADADQSDVDGDGVGDACDDCVVLSGADCDEIDPDGDRYCTSTPVGAHACLGLDNCPDVRNPDQNDRDDDGRGDACNDDVDLDGDEIADARDTCPETANADQADLDGDGVGDACDPDLDDDGYCNDQAARDGDRPGCIGIDNCPRAANPDQADADDDHVGDACSFSTTAE